MLGKKKNTVKSIREPIYIQLKHTIASEIKSGRYPENSPLPAVNIIAERAGVSVRTAYLAVKELVRDGLCYQRPKKGTFVGSDNLFKKHLVCAVWSRCNVETPLAEPLANIFFCGLLQGCASHEITPVLVADNPESVIRRYNLTREFECRGVLVLDHDKFDAAVKLAEKFPEKRFFFINYMLKNFNNLPSNMTAVVNDNYYGGYKMIEYFIAQGKKHFKLISVKLPVFDRTYHERIKGALAALKDYGIEISKSDLLLIPPEHHEQEIYLTTRKMLRSGERPEVVFCTNDIAAEKVKNALISENLDTQIAVGGYDYIYPHISKNGGFPTMQVMYSEMVMKAMSMLKNGEISKSRIIKLKPKIVINN